MTQERLPDTRVRVSVYYSRETGRRVDAYARTIGISRSNAITILIERGLQNTGQTAIDFRQDGEIL